jgi:hypothetical protein
LGGDRLKRCNKLWQILGDDLPHDVVIDAKVVVHDLVTHADDVRPPDARVVAAELLGNLPCGFADGLDEMLTAFLAMSSMWPT